MDIGKRIKNFRECFPMTQAELAEKLSLSVHTISKYEQGQRQPKMKQLEKIASVLRVSVEDLLGINNISLEDKTDSEIRININNESKIKELLSENEIFDLKKEIVGIIFKYSSPDMNGAIPDNMGIEEFDRLINSLQKSMNIDVGIKRNAKNEPIVNIYFCISSSKIEEGE